MSKYEPLPQFLSGTENSVRRLTFAEIERILGFKLPQSAYEHEAWWSNNATGHSHARAWVKAGWRTQDLDLAGRKVTFRRSGAASATPSTPTGDRWGCMSGTVTIMPGTDLTAPLSDVWNAEEGKILND
ncbi:MAG TPA: hypothetical protein VFX37_11050 [Pseudolabrys sp.]|nr:hypothetical protein [Pseudolabrys sp.]